MNTDNGALDFDVDLNIQKLMSSITLAENRIKGFSDTAVNEGKKTEDIFSKIGPLVGAYFGVEALKGFAGQLVKVRGEFQKYEAVLTNTFGSNTKAVASMEMLTDIASKTPFQLDAITDSYIKLVNQGFEPTREEIIKMGDLASSTGKGFDQLVEAILDAQNGEFERLKEFGIKASVAGDKVKMTFKGQTTEIDKSAEAMRAYILSLGGMQGVAGSMAAISQTLVGQLSNLEDAWSQMLNEIGTESEDVMSGLISGASWAIEHYKEILQVLTPIVATYGAYKAAIMAAAAAQKAAAAFTFVKEYMAMGRALGFATANQISFNRAALMNPYALAAAAIVGLSVVIYQFASNMSAAEEAQQHLNDAMDDANDKIVEETSKVTSLVDVINDENNSREYRNKKLQELIALNPELLQGLTLESIKTDQGRAAIDAYVSSLEKKIKMQALETELTESIKRKQDATNGKDNTSWVDYAKASIYSIGGGAGGAAASSAKMVEYNQKNNADIIKAETELQEKIKSKISDITNENKDSGKKIADVVINADYWEKQIKASKEALDTLDTNSSTYAADRQKLLNTIKNGESELDRIRGGKKGNKEIKDKNKDEVDAFEQALKDELKSAKSVLDALSILEKKKAEIKGTSDVDKGKQKAIGEEEKDQNQRLKDQTSDLLDTYGTYLSKKLKLEEQYNLDMAILKKQLEKATTEQEKQTITGTMSNRTKKYNEDIKQAPDTDYSQMLSEYRNYEEKKKSLIEDFDKKRQKAQENGNTELIKKLNEAQENALSGLAVESLMASPDWNRLFGDLEKVSVSELIKLRDKIETEFSNLDLTPDDLEALRAKLNEVTAQIQQRNPFKALSDAIAKYKKDQNSANLKDIAKSLAGSIEIAKGSFDSLVGAMDTLGVKMDDGTRKVMSDISNMLGAAGDIAVGIATGNPLQIIQGSIDLLANGIDLIFGGKGRKLDRSIQSHAGEVERLKVAYEELEKAIDNALGSDRYASQKAQIENLKKQQQEYAAMAAAEKEKKKTDEGKVGEYESEIKANSEAISDAINGMREEILGMDLSSAANELGGAIIDAFAAGEDAAKAWGDKVNDIVGDVIRKMLIQKLVEEPVGDIINKYMAKWVDSEGNFLGFDAVMSSASQMGEELSGLGAGLSAALGSLPDDIKKYITGDGSGTDPKALSGAVKGMTEESASLLSGYANAIRINQIESIAVLRSQLIALNQIASNTAYNINLVEILSVLKSINTTDSLRSQGL